MTIPQAYEMFPEFMECLADGQVHTLGEMRAHCAEILGLTDEEINLMRPRGDMTVFYDRFSWAATYLKKAGLIESPGRSRYRMTALGKQVYDEDPKQIDTEFLQRFQGYRDFVTPGARRTVGSDVPAADAPAEEDTRTPQDIVQDAVDRHNRDLADKLMEEVLNMPPADFEKLVVKLLVKMGYGTPEYSASTRYTDDEGIDGIVSADRFGFDSVYIQAKRWRGTAVGRPEIQKFTGSLMGQGATKGLFITTAGFTREAREFAEKNLTSKIVLVDGEELAKLMIEFDVGVSPDCTYELKRIDYDFFSSD